MSHVEATNTAMIGGIVIDKLAYVDDIDMLIGSVTELQTKTDKLEVVTGIFGMKINEDKTKSMHMSRFNNPSPPKIKLNGTEIEWVDSFTYLWSQITSDNNHSVDIKWRLALGSATFKALMLIWKQHRISVKLKLKLCCSIIIPIAMYGCETWTVRVDDSRRLAAFEPKLLRQIAGITYVDRVSNADLLKRLPYNTTILNRVHVQQFRGLDQVQCMCNENYQKLPSKVASTVLTLVVALRSAGRRTSPTATSLVILEWHKTESRIGDKYISSWGERPLDDHQGRMGIK